MIGHSSAWLKQLCHFAVRKPVGFLTAWLRNRLALNRFNQRGGQKQLVRIRAVTYYSTINIAQPSKTIYRKENGMAESVYKVIELVGTSEESWEKATATAIERAAQSLRDLRIGEVTDLDVQVKDGKVEAYRVKVKVSFKYEEGE
jgi:flavin-binding protein dodecin